MNRIGRALLACGLSVWLVACAKNDDDKVNAAGENNTEQTQQQAGAGDANIVDTAVAADTFNTLVTALQTTGLDTILSDESRSFTVFAPTDEAFSALGQDAINALLNDSDTLSDILLYHVIADESVNAETAIGLAGKMVTMANEKSAALSLDGMRLFINDAEVTMTDIATSNGIIHVIDAVLTPPADSGVSDNEPMTNIVETAIAAGNFTTLAAALEATDLVSVLADETREFTVFAPTDDAFALLGEEAITALLADPDKLRDILLYHVLADAAVNAETAISLAGTTVTTANEDDIALSLNEGSLFVNLSEVTATDIRASNGIIHVIDAVLIPPMTQNDDVAVSIVDTAIEAGGFSTLVAALQATGLDATLASEDSSFTVFAPTDEAFAKLGADAISNLLANPEELADILLYHVVGDEPLNSTEITSLAGSTLTTVNGATIAVSHDGDRLLVNQSEIISADVVASNGIIHAIDTVLLPPSDSQGPSDDETGMETGTLLDVARAAGNFNTLVAALELTGLDGAIGHSGDLYTVFAPTDEAFAALGQETIDALLADPATLRDILLYHVIPGTVVDSTTALSLVGVSIQAGNGDRFELNLRSEGLFINDSQIVVTDIQGVNGVIHVIDAVLIPPQ